MQSIITVLKACLVGGCIGVICQICMLALGSLGLDTLFVLFWTIFITGTIGALMTLPGWYAKLEEFGGFGAILPLSGLAAALAGLHFQLRTAGKSVAASYGGVWAFFLKVTGPGIIVAIITGAVMALAF